MNNFSVAVGTVDITDYMNAPGGSMIFVGTLGFLDLSGAAGQLTAGNFQITGNVNPTPRRRSEL